MDIRGGISTLDGFREYIYTRLGQPVINVEIAPEQIDIAIYDTVQDFQRYNYGEGTYLDYTTLCVSAGVSEYSVKGSSIEFAYDIDLSYGMGGINTLFTPIHMMMYNTASQPGGFLGGGTGGGIGGMGPAGTVGPGGIQQGVGPITQYETAMEYYELAKMMFGRHYTVSYNLSKDALIVTPTPEETMIATLSIYRRAEAERLYNHPLVKKLAVARAKVQWGIHLTKYGATMPDGISINGQDMMSQGREDEDKYLEQMRKESDPIDFFCA